MSRQYRDILESFDIGSLPDLDIVVLGALELFQETDLPKIDLSHYKHPLIVGSGNAEATGRIIFNDQDAIFASESDYENKLNSVRSIDGVVLVSASGGKHAPIIAKKAKEMAKGVTLITNTVDSPAHAELDLDGGDSEYVFPKNREPYTYNTSTYMGMILGKTGEDPSEIANFIHEQTSQIKWPDFSQFDKYYLVVPPEFAGIIRMLQVKFIELFGRNVARDVETSEYVRHATTVAASNEMFISFGEENTQWGKSENRIHVPLPDNADYGAMMAVGYYTVAQIQKAQPQYFKENIEQYTTDVSKIFGQNIPPIVEN